MTALKVLENGDLISGSNDGTIKVWSLEDRTMKKSVKVNLEVWSLEMLKNGNLVCGCKNGTIKVWE